MDVSFGLNDFYHVSSWDVKAHNEAHERDLAWLNAQVESLEESDVNVMIFSHWSPSADTRAIEPRHVESPVSSAFLDRLVWREVF